MNTTKIKIQKLLTVAVVGTALVIHPGLATALPLLILMKEIKKPNPKIINKPKQK